MTRAWLVLALLAAVTGVSSTSDSPESLRELGPAMADCQARSSHAQSIFTNTELFCPPGEGAGRIVSHPVACPNASRAGWQASVFVQEGRLTFQVLDQEDAIVYHQTLQGPAEGLTGASVGKGQPGHGWHLVAETSEAYRGAFVAQLRCGLGL